VSNGKRATDLRGFGRNSETLIAARTVQSRAQSFVEQHKLLAGELSAQDQALTRVVDMAHESKQLILGAISSGRAETLTDTLNSLFSQAADALNWKHEGRYLFAGSQVDIPPVAVDDLASLVATPPADVFDNDSARTVSRLNESSTITTGFLASSVGAEFFDILREIQVYHTGVNGPLNGVLNETQLDFLKDKLGDLETAHEGLISRVAENGLLQQRVADAQEAQMRRVDMLKGFIGDIAEVDVAEAFTRLEQARMATQASAQALRALQQTSLLNLLGTGN
ncbi:MAG: hypothetical protein M3M95_03570, partial [Pseudomonadota bacterium]|nr:hypothetical protein [Pseudomonadota bacterium]